MFGKLWELRLKYSTAPLLALAVIPLTVISVGLTGGGHASQEYYWPFALISGPLAIIVQFLFHGPIHDTFRQGVYPVFTFLGPYPLYVLYGSVFALLSRKNPVWRWLFVAIVICVHVLSALFFLSEVDFS